MRMPLPAAPRAGLAWCGSCPGHRGIPIAYFRERSVSVSPEMPFGAARGRPLHEVRYRCYGASRTSTSETPATKVPRRIRRPSGRSERRAGGDNSLGLSARR